MSFKKLIKTILLLIIAPVVANAQSSKDFKGASIAINYSSNNSKHAQGLDVDVDGKVDEKIKHSKNNNIPGIDLSYSFEINEKFILRKNADIILAFVNTVLTKSLTCSAVKLLI